MVLVDTSYESSTATGFSKVNATFTVTVFGLWRLAGRPDGPEAILITNLVQPALRRLGRAA